MDKDGKREKGPGFQAQVINLLRELQRTHGLTYLFISHSMPLVRYFCDRVAVIEHGDLVEMKVPKHHNCYS